MREGMLLASFWITLSAVAPLAWAQPAITPDAAVMALDELGLYRVGYVMKGEPEHTLPTGWSGDFDDLTGVACRPEGIQNGMNAFLLHVPWRGGTGVVFQEFLFALPAATHIELRGATAMGPTAVVPGHSDGSTYRVICNGQVLLDDHRADARWKPFSLDLTRFAGQRLTLRFENDPGPRGNASFDFSLWGNRELVCEGAAINAPTPPATPPLDLATLRPAREGSVVPSVTEVRAPQLQLTGDRAELRSQTPCGVLSFVGQRPDAEGLPALGNWDVTLLRPGTTAPVRVPLARFARIEWTGPAIHRSSRFEPAGDGVRLVREDEIGGRLATFTAEFHLVGQSLVCEMTCAEPLIQAIDCGGWGPTLRRRTVPLPYCVVPVNELPTEGLFSTAFLDWTSHTSATLHQGTRAAYQKRSDGSRVPLVERAVYTASPHLAEVLPNLPFPPSPYLDAVGGRLVLDIWGGSFDSIAQNLETLGAHGVRDGVVLIHNWQRDGYDNGLPAHYPAAADKGGEPAMKRLIATGRQLGHFMALHENYVDYYPNYEGFDPNDISLDEAGEPQKAWFNKGTGIQSFAVKPTAILRLAGAQSPEILKRYQSNACFLDVHSAVHPWFHVDHRASEEGASQLALVRDTHRALWAFERELRDGPVFGEGNRHAYWAGMLDGVEAQFGIGWPENQGQSAPLLVDFDLLKIHSLQANHGMGYHGRWWDEAAAEAWDWVPPMDVMDQYRLQTLAFGHAPFLSHQTWNSVPLAILESRLAAPVAARYAGRAPTRIAYEHDGRWVDATQAIHAQAPLNRLQVDYGSTLSLTCNQSNEPLTVDAHTLPRFGWLAQGPGFEAGTTLRDGQVTDFLDTGNQLLANARPATDWNLSRRVAIRPTVQRFEQSGDRTIRFEYDWDVRTALDRDYQCFVHFGPTARGDRESILFQQDHALPGPTSQWKPPSVVTDGPYTLTIPQSVADGDYAWTIGLHHRDTGRLLMEGPPGGQDRVRLGTLSVSEQGRAISFEPASESSPPSPYLQHVNLTNRLIDFGPLATDGCVSLERDGADWLLRPYPTDRPFLIQLDANRFPPPATITCEGGSEPAVAPARDGSTWIVPLNGSRSYRWSAE